MLSYRHAFHAGNHADVLKHCLLVHLLTYLNEKDKPWWYVDTHAGAGIYDLQSDAARKLGEFETGIGRLWDATDLPAPLAEYMGLVRALNPDGRLRLYPGSPWLAGRLMRRGDQLRLYELHGSDAPLLHHALEPAGRTAKVEQADGLTALKAVLPPPSRRGLVLIDPSYELKEDYRRVITAVKEGLSRFATGIYVLWYPMLQRMESRDLPERLKRLPAKRWLHVSLQVRAAARDGFGMHGSGLFVINPPWVTAELMASVLPYLARHLGQDAQATHTLEYHAD
ncbi:MAG TPA: 23S rRNA (adenine(2030)-N(6))-methyltransferase RlmJ [Thiobacillaceae bacterium]|nr:23S rRNA (adenine(2030)-N(6))-methyltransferase RlmJ [Thiobacillaceae bacterium]